MIVQVRSKKKKGASQMEQNDKQKKNNRSKRGGKVYLSGIQCITIFYKISTQLTGFNFVTRYTILIQEFIIRLLER